MNPKIYVPWMLRTLLLTLIVILPACGLVNKTSEAENISQITYGEPLKMMKVDLNENPLNKTVCDPFTETQVTTMDHGITASLHYLVDGMPRMYKSTDYIQFARRSEKKLFFADLNVPTRMFTEGFSTQTDDVLKTDGGEKLIEYFGVKFETILKLAENDTEGDYEFALLSDDGTTLSTVDGTGSGATEKILIASEGDHPTRMGCANQITHLTRESALPLKLTYYQGPRYHISNVLMWRKASVAGKDALCGTNGNETFFDPAQSSAPQKAYKDLLARGWKVVQKENFFIPSSENYNPCVSTGTNPVITGFKTAEIFSTGVFLSWLTDIPAASQVKLVNKATGEVILPPTDNALRTSHTVQVTGLTPQTTYTAQAVSVSENLGHSLSAPIEFTTP